MDVDVVIVGGGPSGLSAALALGRARRRVLLVDGGPRRNARAERVWNLLGRDGTPPDELRVVCREQLARYPSVTLHDAPVTAIEGARGAFEVTLSGAALSGAALSEAAAGPSTGAQVVRARRVLLATGMIDEMLPIPGFEALWGRAIVQCPYCHGFEHRDQRWGYLARAEQLGHVVPFAVQLGTWTRDVTVFTNGAFELSADALATLEAAGVKVETRRIARLREADGTLAAVVLEGGGHDRGAQEPSEAGCDLLFAHPEQRPVPLVASLVRTHGLRLDGSGFVVVDEETRQTSVPGIYAAGDLTTLAQGAIVGAASGTQAATRLHTELAMAAVTAGAR